MDDIYQIKPSLITDMLDTQPSMFFVPTDNIVIVEITMQSEY